MKCKNCEINDAIRYSKYSKGEFCSKQCSKSFSTKKKRKEINKKVSEKLKGSGNGEVINKCVGCGNEFTVEFKNRKQKSCSKKCSTELRWRDGEYREKMTNIVRERCDSLEERIRLREIGRSGGFGKKGYTEKGTYYQSLLEKECFEYLEENGIEFDSHKNIPNSSKVSDIYLIDKDIWIEIDGIDREKRKKWLGKNYDYWIEKLELYKKLKLKIVIVKNLDELIKV